MLYPESQVPLLHPAYNLLFYLEISSQVVGYVGLRLFCSPALFFLPSPAKGETGKESAQCSYWPGHLAPQAWWKRQLILTGLALLHTGNFIALSHHFCRKPRAGFEELLHPLVTETNFDSWCLVQITKDAKKERFCQSPGITISRFARRGGNGNRPLNRLTWIQERLILS